MSCDDPSAQPTSRAPVEPVATTRIAATRNGFSLRRGIATATLATGLLALGGVAVVNAAGPSASPNESISPDATSAPDASDEGGPAADRAGDREGRGPRGGALGDRGDCPDKGGAGGADDGADDDGGTTPSPSPSTTTGDTDV